jgi:hypothetical protein
LEDSSNLAQVVNVALLGPACDFVQPAQGDRFEARFSRSFRRVHDFDFNLDRQVAALNLAFAFFALFSHSIRLGNKRAILNNNASDPGAGIRTSSAKGAEYPAR